MALIIITTIAATLLLTALAIARFYPRMNSRTLNIPYEGVAQVLDAYSYIKNELAQTLGDYSGALSHIPNEFTLALNTVYEKNGGKGPQPPQTLRATSTVAPNIRGQAEIKVVLLLAPGGMVSVEVFDTQTPVAPRYFNPKEV